MNTKCLLIGLVAIILCSCSSVYKSGQTPDDVYYSPKRPVVAAPAADQQQMPSYGYSPYAEQSQIRLGIYDPRWRYLDDFSYSPYLYGYNYGYYYNPFYSVWPVYNPILIGTPVPVNTTVIRTPRTTNLGTYTSFGSHSSYSSPGYISPVRPYNGGTNGLSNTLNRMYNNGNNGNSYYNGNRSYNPTYNNNGGSRSYNSGGSSSGGGGGAARPARSGRG